MNALIHGTNSRLQTSRLGLGTMNFGANVDKATAAELLDMALDHGVNLVDTAETYPFPPTAEYHGLSESFIGSWLNKSRKRNEIALISKIAGPSPHLDYLRDGNLSFDEQNINASIEQSLKRLQTDYLDIVLLHWPERATNTLGQLDYKPARKETSQSLIHDRIELALVALDKVLKAGKIRAYGISNETPWGVMRFLSYAEQLGLTKPTVLQQRYSLLDRSFDIGLAEVAHREDLGVISYSPLAFGLLSHQAHSEKEFRPGPRLSQTRKLHRYLHTNCVHAAKQYYELACDRGLDLSQMAIAYLLTRGYVTSVLIGASNKNQLAQNLGALNIRLDRNTLKAIDDIHHQRPNPCL